MKRDLKINFAILEEIIREVRKYKSALKDMEAAASNIVNILESNIADFIDEFKKLYMEYIKELRQCYTELDDLDIILTGYTSEMQAIIRPIDKNKPVRVDRNDIYFNKETIIAACRSIDFLVTNKGKSGLSYLSSFGKDEEEKQREEQNFRKLESIFREVIPRYSRRLNAQVEALNNIYNRKVVPYENKDDEYKAKAQVLYYKYSNPWEIFRSSFKADMKAVADFIGGAARAIIDLVKGIAVLAWGILSYTASAVTLAVTYPFDARPKWAEQKFNQSNEAIGAILKNPMLIAEGMAQQISDTFEEKGAAYCIGYAAGDFFGGKGIDKLAKISKAKALGKSDAVDDIGDVVKIADSGLDEVVEVASKSIISPEMERKILYGERANGNKIIGGHSPQINNANPNYAVEVISEHADRTNMVKFITQYSDGNLAKIKASTLFPEKWSNQNIIDSIKTVGDTPAIGVRDNLTLHRGIVNGVEIDVIKEGNNVISGYPTGGKLTPGFNPVK